jgi:hypothetical protein
MGRTASDGTYSISGLPPGDAKVAIDTESVKKSQPTGFDPKQGGKAIPPEMKDKMAETQVKYVPIPAKYAKADSSGLSCTIKPGTQKDVNFTLTK